MANKKFINILIAIAALFCAATANAQDNKQIVVEETTTVTTTYSDGTTEQRVLQEGETISPEGVIVTEEADEFDESKLRGIARRYSHFVWGAETGMSIDLSGMDMSTYNFDILFGYRNKWIQTVGVGGGIHKSLGTKDSFIPVYVLFRSSFRPKPSVCFFHLRIGYSFNTISNSPTVGDTNCAIGCGANLTRSKRMQSYLLVAYSFRHFNRRHTEIVNLEKSNVSLAQIAFGLTF